jgi:hypothetical protein
MNLVLATSLSMFITFALHCVLEETGAHSSLFQRFVVDECRNCFLVGHCWLKGRLSMWLSNQFSDHDTVHIGLASCSYFLGDNPDKLCVLMTVAFSIIVLVLFYGLQVINRIRSLLFTIVILWLVASYLDVYNLRYQMDVLTVCFLVWQCVNIMCQWADHVLPWPCLILQQGSLCVLTSLESLLAHELVFRYLPIQIKFTLLWLWSLCDV